MVSFAGFTPNEGASAFKTRNLAFAMKWLILLLLPSSQKQFCEVEFIVTVHRKLTLLVYHDGQRHRKEKEAMVTGSSKS